jgi:RNA polymerase sigma factor (sigma-70 family)
MRGASTRIKSQPIEVLFGAGTTAGMTDEQLLERFVSGRDEAAETAFTALVRRHGGLVLRVCRHVLGDLHLAEDAFQATFLVLARRASSIREPGLLGPWLYGVARRTAQKAKDQRRRREHREQPTEEIPDIEAASGAGCALVRSEEVETLLREIERLPDKYRRPVVLCHLEGLTHEEAARQLRWPMGTLGVRLMRARDRLRSRLVRSGAGPAALAVLGAPLKPEVLTPSLVDKTATLAAAFVSRSLTASGPIPTQIIAIAEGVLRTMTLKKLTIVMAVVSTVGIIAVNAAVFGRQIRDAGKGNAATTTIDQKAKPKDAEAPSLLSNGGFEEGDPKTRMPTDWQNGAQIAGVEYRWDRGVAHGGRSSLALKKTVARFFPIAEWSQSIPRTGNATRLKVTTYIKAQKVTKAVLDVQFGSANGQGSHQWAIYIGARNNGDPPTTHGWKAYDAVVEIPNGSETIVVAPQIYGPGEIWFDDLRVTYDQGASKSPPTAASGDSPAAAADVADVPSEERSASGDSRKHYLLVGPMTSQNPPTEGYRLLVVLPGGDGSADFYAFSKRIAKNALPPGYLLAQAVATKWSEKQAEQIVWPTAADRVAEARFTTEEFINDVVADVKRTKKVDPRYIFTLGWSSGGPPIYASSLRRDTPVTGSFVAMSVFRGERQRTLTNARNQAYYILHSPQDSIPIRMAQSAQETLTKNGAKVQLQAYEGGHGWHGDVFGEIRRGIEWLEKNHAATGPR